MANIVELQENGVSQFLKTHAAAVTGLKEAIVEIVYPVGSFYVSNVLTDPAEILGAGVWERVKGRSLFGVDESDNAFSTSGLTGGTKTEKLTIEQIPPHTHSYTSNNINNFVKVEASSTYGQTNDSTRTSGSTGGGQAHNNMHPYYTVYMWHRTA